MHSVHFILYTEVIAMTHSIRIKLRLVQWLWFYLFANIMCYSEWPRARNSRSNPQQCRNDGYLSTGRRNKKSNSARQNPKLNMVLRLLLFGCSPLAAAFSLYNPKSVCVLGNVCLQASIVIKVCSCVLSCVHLLWIWDDIEQWHRMKAPGWL